LSNLGKSDSVIATPGLIRGKQSLRKILKQVQNDKIIFYLFIFLLPTQFGKHFWLDFSYVLGQRVDYLSPTLYTTDILVIALFLISLFKNKIRVNPIFSLTVLFLSVSIFLSANVFVGWYGLLKFFELSFLVWYISQNSKPITHNSKLFILFSIGILFESLLAIFQIIHQGSLGGIFYFFGERSFTASTPGIANASVGGQLILRPYGTFSHPNMLAGYLVVAMLLVVYFWRKQKNVIPAKAGIQKNLGSLIKSGMTIENALLALVLFLGSLALFLSLSRVAIVSWIIAGLMLAFFYTKEKLKRSFLFIGLGVLTFLVLLFVFFPELIFRFAISPMDESVVMREQLAKTAFAMIASHPLFGVGLNNFISSIPQFSQSSFILQPVHSIYLLVAAELGIPGLLFFLGLLWFLVKSLLKKWFAVPVIPARQSASGGKAEIQSTRHSERSEESKSWIPGQARDDNAKKALLSLGLALFVILFSGLFDHYFLTLQQGQLLFAVVIGISLQRSKMSFQNP